MSTAIQEIEHRAPLRPRVRSRAAGRTARERAHPRAGRPPLVALPPLDDDPLVDTSWENDPAALCANLTLCVVEILAGARALDQISRWVTDAVYVHLLRRTVIAARSRELTPVDARRPRVRIGEPHVSTPAPGVVEAVVLVHQPGRSRAVALRLERHRERWRATNIAVL